MMNTYGLIGYPLTHSFSKPYFTEKFLKEGLVNCVYENYAIATIQEIESLFPINNLKGLNVTIPYKEAVIPFLDGLSSAAMSIGAVNTIKNENGKWIGYNTDHFGFQESWGMLLSPHHQSALVLGTGGAAKAVWYVLQQKNMPFIKVSRQSGKDMVSYDELTRDIMENHTVIINTTPLGMYPNIDNCPPIPYEYIGENHYLYDLVYNPAKTLFLQNGEKNGATIKAGMDMLHLQADKAWEIWNS